MAAAAPKTERVHFTCSPALFEMVHREATAIMEWLRGLLPASAEILHIGATSIPDCLTKGDLDLVVRINRHDFVAARDALDSSCGTNLGSVRDESFASYAIEGHRLPVGVQLVVRGSTYDGFHIFWDRMRASPSLREDYNALKQRWEGGDMEAYRAAKNDFISAVLSADAIERGSAP